MVETANSAGSRTPDMALVVDMVETADSAVSRARDMALVVDGDLVKSLGSRTQKCPCRRYGRNSQFSRQAGPGAGPRRR